MFSWMTACDTNSKECWKAGPGPFTHERGPERCEVGPARHQAEAGAPRAVTCGAAVPERRDFTFTGDAVRQQLVAHKARADDLLARVPALLFAGPAACSENGNGRGCGRRTRTAGFSVLLGLGLGLGKCPQGGLVQKGRLCGLEPTRPSHGRPPGSGSGHPGCRPRSQPWTDKWGARGAGCRCSELEEARQTRVGLCHQAKASRDQATRGGGAWERPPLSSTSLSGWPTAPVPPPLPRLRLPLARLPDAQIASLVRTNLYQVKILPDTV